MPSSVSELPVATHCHQNVRMSPWDHLGQLIVARRLQLGFKTRIAFAEALGISPRTLGDLETGRKDRYEASTFAKVENVLQWRTGSIQRILNGGDPQIHHTVTVSENLHLSDTPTAVVTRAVTQEEIERDEALRRVMGSDLDDAQKRALIRMLILERERADQARIAHAEEMIRFARGEN